MSIALTNLDDRRWVDLVEDGRAMIPFYSPKWTDHNIHDPGITLIELFAWLAEMDIYRLNRIPERHLRKFLSLIGIHPYTPKAAIAILTLAAREDLTQPLLRIPSSTEFDGVDAFGETTRYRTTQTIYVVPSELKAVQIKNKNGFRDLTDSWRRGEEIEPFGPDAETGAEFYLGFSAPFLIDTPVSLVLISQDLSAGQSMRRSLLTELRAEKKRCATEIFVKCDPRRKSFTKKKTVKLSSRLSHHSVRLAWEFLSDEGRWRELTQGRDGEVIDETRALTLNGRLVFRLPAAIAQEQIGKNRQSLYYLRARLARGAYDAPPQLLSCALNSVFLKQTTAVGTWQWPISSSAGIKGTPPKRGHSAWITMRFNKNGHITQLTFRKSPEAVKLSVLEYQSGVLRVEAIRLGAGDGKPNLSFSLPEAPALLANFGVFTIENGRVRKWSRRISFDASTRADAHFGLEPTKGLLIFGDGERGRVVPRNVPIFVRYNSTRADAGNLTANTITHLADTPHNRAILGSSDPNSRLTLITNTLPATGGTAAETMNHAIGRAIELVDKTERAVTLADYEGLASNVPGTRLARVSARANLHPGFPCLNAQGMITVIAIPYLPLDRPTPSVGLRSAIGKYLFSRRIIGSRVEVIGPAYKEVVVHAQVKALPRANKADVSMRVIAMLNRFFHPLTGGPEATGWPLGRDVFRSEVLQVIDDTSGVDHVISLQFVNGCGQPECGNICLAANELVAAGEHQLEIL
ncbi:MAG TPA: putative baseplate assembly protein [Pyrinomonadaceae bacterium]|nr:putative baseplate assembly protein [Pyrinomonadaceae bacterium]